MNRRAAQALRLVAGARALEIGIGLVCFVITRWLWSQAWEHSGTPIETITHRFEILAKVQSWSSFGLEVLTLVGLALMVSALDGRARRLATAAIVAMTIELALLMFERVVPAMPVTRAPYRFSPVREALWVIQIVVANGASLLALLAAMPVPARRTAGRHATLAFVALAGLLLVFRVGLIVAPSIGSHGQVFNYVWFAVGSASGVAFVLAALWLARDVAHQAPSDVAEPGTGRRDPRPFRLFGQAVVARVVAGVPLAIVATVATARGAADVGQVALVAGTIVSVAVAAMLVASLAGQRRLPEALCARDALTLAMVLACVAPVLDIWGAVATGELLSAVGAATHATSFWGGPSLSRIEELQSTATWIGRISVCLGLIGSFAVVQSLAATAGGLGDETLASRARRVRSLLISGTAGAIITWLLISNLQLGGENLLLLLLLIAAVLLTIGIVLLVEMLRLTYGLAAALQFSAPPAGPPNVTSAFPA